MHARHTYFVLQLIIFGLGAGVRYLFFFIIGRKKRYDDLITPKLQDKWNVIVGFMFAAIVVYLAVKYSPSAVDRSYPPLRKH